MINLKDFDVYATDEGLFIVGNTDTATKVAGPQTSARSLAPELAEAWGDVQGDAGSITPVEVKKRTTGRTGRSKSTEDYDPTENKCKDCGSSNVYTSEGCLTCMECGWSKCG